MNKINYTGMDEARIIRLSTDVFNKLKQEKSWVNTIMNLSSMNIADYSAKRKTTGNSIKTKACFISYPATLIKQ